MASHTLRLVYDGLDASRHQMPTSSVKQIVAGAQEFLGAHAYFLTEGRIPTNINDHSRHFRLHDIRQRDGSWEAHFLIDLFVDEYLRNLTKDAARFAATGTWTVLGTLVYMSIEAWRTRRPIADQTFDRIEPTLSFSDGNREPIIDVHREREHLRRLLFERVDASMSKMTAPIGRAATHVDLWFDDRHLERIEHRFLEREITEAVRELRQAKLRGAAW